MFCPNCGQADQAAGKYCKGCWKYLPDNSFGSINRYSPQSIAGWIVAGNCVGLAMFLIALLSVFLKSPPLLIGLLTGAPWGLVLGTTVYALILYRRLKRTNSQELKSLSKMDSTRAHRSLTAVDTSRIVEVESVTEETTALLKIGRDTELDR
jgi:hypothetical protein